MSKPYLNNDLNDEKIYNAILNSLKKLSEDNLESFLKNNTIKSKENRDLLIVDAIKEVSETFYKKSNLDKDKSYNIYVAKSEIAKEVANHFGIPHKKSILNLGVDEKIQEFVKDTTNTIINNIEKDLSKAGIEKYTGYDKEQIEVLKKGEKENLDVSLYANSNFNSKQMEQIYFALKDGIKMEDIKKIANPEFSFEQMEELRNGAMIGSNISIYANPDFDIPQMRLIKNSLKIFKNDEVLKFANPKFNYMQMLEIRNGIREKVDISLYAYPNIDYKKMEEIRKKLENEQKTAQTAQKTEISIKEKLQKSSKLSNKNLKKETKKELSL